MTPRDRFALSLRKARREAAITQEELGLRCDLHRTEISLLERGQREPQLGSMLRLCGVLGVTPEGLCGGIEWNVDARRFELTQ